MLLSVSSTAVAFFGVYYKLQNFLMMPINGLGQAVIPIVGYNYGAKKSERVHQTWKVLLPTGIVIALCGTLIFCALPKQLLQLFSASPETLVLGIPGLWFLIKSFGITHGWYAFWIAETAACIYSYCTSHKLLKNISK